MIALAFGPSIWWLLLWCPKYPKPGKFRHSEWAYQFPFPTTWVLRKGWHLHKSSPAIEWQYPCPLLPPADLFEYCQILLFCLFRVKVARLVSPKHAPVLLACSGIAGTIATSHSDLPHFKREIASREEHPKTNVELTKWMSCSPAALVKQLPHVNAGNSLGMAVPSAPVHHLFAINGKKTTLTLDSVTDHNLLFFMEVCYFSTVKWPRIWCSL